MAKNNLICIGTILGAFGVNGELRVKSFCAVPEALGDYGPLTDETGEKQFDLRISKAVKSGFAVRIKGIRYKDQADALKGVSLFVSRDVLPSLPDDEFYHSDLIGLTVKDTGGQILGKVNAVHDHGAGDFLEIAQSGSSKTALLPFTQQAIPTIDLSNGIVIADPPAGVFDDG